MTRNRTHPAGRHPRPGYLDRAGQERLLAAVRAVLAPAPLYVPRMPKTGKPMSVAMSNCGPLGWVTDEARLSLPGDPSGDRCAVAADPGRSCSPRGGISSGYPHPPQACLINFYAADARMGLHQDRDEQDFAAPVVSLSLGDTCLFRIGGTRRNDRDPFAAPRLRRRGRARRRGAARLPWRRSHHAGNLDPAAGGRADQSDAAAGDQAGAMIRYQDRIVANLAALYGRRRRTVALAPRHVWRGRSLFACDAARPSRAPVRARRSRADVPARLARRPGAAAGLRHGQGL